MSTSTATVDAAREWLAGADTQPDHAYRWWGSHPDGVAIIPLGRIFEAIEVPPSLADAVLASPRITGPVIRYGEAGHICVLVPVGTSATWEHEQALCLDARHFLSVPDPDRCSPSGAHWVRPPDGSGKLTEAGALAGVLAEVTK